MEEVFVNGTNVDFIQFEPTVQLCKPHGVHCAAQPILAPSLRLGIAANSDGGSGWDYRMADGTHDYRRSLLPRTGNQHLYETPEAGKGRARCQRGE